MTWVTVLKVGADGGSINLLGQDNGNGVWKYVVTTDESALKGLLSEEDARELDFISKSEVIEGWDNAIEFLSKRYRIWMKLHPLACHPQYREKVWKLLCESCMLDSGCADEWKKVLNVKNIESDFEKAHKLFKEAGFDLPAIPDKLSVHLKQQTELDFSTRTLPKSVNYIDFYVDEANKCQVDDYLILSRAAWSPSVHTIHYFLVSGPLRMFLQLCWGGTYMTDDDSAAQIKEIQECFSLADQIIPLAMAVCKASDRLTIVTQTLGGNNFWVAPDQGSQGIKRRCNSPKDVLDEVLQYLRNGAGHTTNFMEDVLKFSKEMDVKDREEFLAMAKQIDREEDELKQ